MTDKCFLLIFLIEIALALTQAQQHNAYSLQTAVDALHRREAQLALRDFENARLAEENAYLNENVDPADVGELQKQQQLNKLLAKYLENDEERQAYEPDFDEEEYGLDERKRSMFRERGETPYQSVFREREINDYQPDLAAKFLEAIDHERNIEREEKYKENLRRLWEKYQQQENEIEQDLFDEENQRKHPFTSEQLQQQQHFGPIIEKRRLILPWLPVVRRKRFPVAKRSPKYIPVKGLAASVSGAGTNEKVAKDLQAIFGDQTIDEKRKRSSGDQIPGAAVAPLTATTEKPYHKIEKKSDHSSSRDDDNVAQDQSQHYDDYQKDHESGPNVHFNDDHDDHDHEHDEHDRDAEHEHDDDEDEDDFEDDDEDDKKKKRAAAAATTTDGHVATVDSTKRSNLEVLKEDQIIPGDLTDFKRKKSVQWSKYFGIDRRKKSTDDWFMNNKYAPQKSEQHIETEYPLKNFRNHDEGYENSKSAAIEPLNEGKLENMDKKLKTIEDLIIDETIKYTGAHEGVSNPEDIQRLKDHVISRLATAYSLEKMRRALDKLRQSVDNERHLEKNQIDGDKDDVELEEKEKRVATKKEKVQFDNNHHSIEVATEKVQHDVPNNVADIAEIDKKKKKSNSMATIIGQQQHPPQQRPYTDYSEFLDNTKVKNLNQKLYPEDNDIGADFEDELGAGYIEPMSEGYMGGGVRQNIGLNQCPLLDTMEKRCRGVDLLSGDINQELLSICGVHQICYLCGTSQSSCDLQYLSEADAVCGHSKECQSAARSALMILRGSPGPLLGPHECAKNACLYRAMKDIGL